jgi:vacuolar-type H+-ATPase subunit E/Vma4
MSAETVEFEAKIIERAAVKRSEVISNAEKKANDIINNAKKETKNIVADAQERAYKILESDLRAAKDQILGEAELEGRRVLANTKDEILSSIFKETEKKITDIANGKNESFDYKDVLLRLIKEAALSIGEEEIVVEANASDREYLQSKLHAIQGQISKELGTVVKLQIGKEPLNCVGGVIVYDTLRRKTYYNTLEGRLLKFRSVLEASLAENLFGG